MTRSVRELWWEDDTLCMTFADTGEVARFKGAYATKCESNPQGGGIEVTPVEVVEIEWRTHDK